MKIPILSHQGGNSGIVPTLMWFLLGKNKVRRCTYHCRFDSSLFSGHVVTRPLHLSMSFHSYRSSVSSLLGAVFSNLLSSSACWTVSWIHSFQFIFKTICIEMVEYLVAILTRDSICIQVHGRCYHFPHICTFTVMVRDPSS